MATAAAANYHARMQRVLDYIDRHLDEDLGLDRLSAVAAFSRHHFHRQFVACFGITVHRHVQLQRLKRASYRLAFRQDSVTAIALDAAYEAPDAFGRSFKQTTGQTPTAFRKSPDWASWHAAFEPPTTRTMPVTKDFTPADVRLIDCPDIPVALMQHRGDPAYIGVTIQRFIAWRRANRLPPARHATYNVFHTDPNSTPVDDMQIDLCVATSRPLTAADVDMVPGVIPAGRCAVLRIIGSAGNLEPGFTWLYRYWLPRSGEEIRDFPPYCQRISFFPDVPEHEAITDLYLPLQ